MSKNITASMLGLIFFVVALSVLNNYQHIMAQNATISNSPALSETFRAHGTLGSIIMPTSLSTLNITSAISGHEGSIIGGNWSFDVSHGSLQNFKVNIEMLRLDGKEDMTHSISGLKNVTTAVTYLSPSTSNKIVLNNNNTALRGFADITKNGKAMWNNIPIFVSIKNGKLMSMSIDSSKTNNHFTGIPIFGIVTSLTK